LIVLTDLWHETKFAEFVIVLVYTVRDFCINCYYSRSEYAQLSFMLLAFVVGWQLLRGVVRSDCSM